jgi:hypothetical protein
VTQYGGGDDRHFLRDWHSQTPEQEHGEDPEVGKVVDELLKRLHGILGANRIRKRVHAASRAAQGSGSLEHLEDLRLLPLRFLENCGSGA